MNFRKVLKNGVFALELKSDTKRGVIEEMIDLLVAANKITDREAAMNCILERERKMSTGMQHGIAIPHGKTNSVSGLVSAFALKKEGMDFMCLDSQPARIFVMTISPVNQTGPHMQYLAEISKMLSMASVRERLLNAASVDDVVTILSEGKPEENDPGQG